MSTSALGEAIETCADGFVAIDADGRILQVNDAFVRQSGYSRDELVGRSFGELTLDGSELLVEPLREGRQRTKNGDVWHVEYAISRQGDRTFAFCRDVGRRKRTEAVLAAREHIARVAVEGTLEQVIVATIDAVEQITESEIGFLHFVEDSQRDLTLQCWSTNTLRHFCTAEGKGTHRPLADAGVWVDCFHARAPVIHDDYASLPHKKGLPEGHALVVRELVIPVMRGERVIALLGVGNKKTSYTEVDVDVAATLASLCIDLVSHKRVEEQLSHSRQRLERLESLQVLAGGVAHDFNNIFTAALGSLELAAHELPIASAARRDVLDARTSIQRAARLSRQMLGLSGGGRLAIASTSWPELLGALPVPAHVTLDLAHGEPTTISGDINQLRRVAEQLVANAVEAIGERPGTILVTTGAAHLAREELDASTIGEPLAPGRYATLTVSDTGHGMDDSTLDRVFDPFFSTRFAGRGLGMSEVLGIVRAHKGTIDVESALGRGTTVRVFLPSVEETSDGPSAEVGPHAAVDVLLVDDEEMVLEFARRTLERAGYRVRVATSGRRAIEIFREQRGRIGMIVLDVTMPDLRGWDVLAQLRTLEPHARVVMSSGYAVETFARQLDGTRGFLAKPYDAPTLLALVNEVLGTP